MWICIDVYSSQSSKFSRACGNSFPQGNRLYSIYRTCTIYSLYSQLIFFFKVVDCLALNFDKGYLFIKLGLFLLRCCLKVQYPQSLKCLCTTPPPAPHPRLSLTSCFFLVSSLIFLLKYPNQLETPYFGPTELMWVELNDLNSRFGDLDANGKDIIQGYP